MPNLPPGFMQTFAVSLVLFRHVTSSSVCWLLETQTSDIYIGFTHIPCVVFGTGCSSELKSPKQSKKKKSATVIKFIFCNVLIADQCHYENSHSSISKCIPSAAFVLMSQQCTSNLLPRSYLLVSKLPCFL